jgi:hypothetical protein
LTIASIGRHILGKSIIILVDQSISNISEFSFLIKVTLAISKMLLNVQFVFADLQEDLRAYGPVASVIATGKLHGSELCNDSKNCNI